MIILLISNNITHNLSNRKDNLLPFYKNIRKDGASLFYISFAEAEYFQPCNALAHLNPSANSNKFELVPCMRTADRLRPIFQTGTAGIRSPRSPFFHRGRSARPRC